MKTYSVIIGKFIIIMLIITSCINKSSRDNHINHESFLDSICSTDTIIDCLKPKIGINVGQNMIIGNFTGQGVDSIWIIERADTIEDRLIEYNYHTKSSNSLLPSVELYGRSCHCAFIMNEGDLDGDGKDEWAWMRGNFKSRADITYHLLHFDDDKWLEFSTDLDKDTRNSDIDIIRKGPTDGSIILSLLYWPEMESSEKAIQYDTIFNPFQDTPILSK